MYLPETAWAELRNEPAIAAMHGPDSLVRFGD